MNTDQSNQPAWPRGWRSALHDKISETAKWDLLIIGGGITGAGIFREATRAGLSVLLVEANDFASGTSSKSSKLVHGGMRYLNQGHFGLVRDSVRERQALLRDAPGLVQPQPFLFGCYKGSLKTNRRVVGIGCKMYNGFAGEKLTKYLDAKAFTAVGSGLNEDKLTGGYELIEAKTDDARLTLRVIAEGIADGGYAANYMRVDDLMLENNQVVGAVIHDTIQNETAEIRAKVVVNTTGAHADELRGKIAREARMRPLRGSHLVFPLKRMPIDRGITWLHCRNQRPVFVYPWEGAVLCGTTDLDHRDGLSNEPVIQPAELDYLLEGINEYFPNAKLSAADAISSYAGVRPVVDTGQENPSEEPRHHAVWDESGMLTVTGGKLTTFRLTAIDALTEAAKHLGCNLVLDPKAAILNTVTTGSASKSSSTKSSLTELRLRGRYGPAAATLLSDTAQLQRIEGTETHWTELKWAANNEAVEYLGDLLHRRTRLGLLLPNGGKALIDKIRAIAQPALAWDDRRWEQEQTNYFDHWQKHHQPFP